MKCLECHLSADYEQELAALLLLEIMLVIYESSAAGFRFDCSLKVFSVWCETASEREI